MGMEAHILAVGQYRKDITDCLDYVNDYYEDTREGVLVATRLFHCNTTNQSRELANAFGIDPWDFNTHHIKAAAAEDMGTQLALSNLIDSSAEMWPEELEQFQKLARAGFLFLYEPNG